MSPTTEPVDRGDAWRRRRGAATVLLVCALVLLAVSLGAPWFSAGTRSPETTMELSYTLWGLGTRLDTDSPPGPSSVSTFTEWDRLDRAEATRGVFQMALGLEACATALGLALAPSALLLRGPRKRRVPLALGSLACLFSLLAPLLFAALLPGALGADGPQPVDTKGSFWGSSRAAGESSSWGPGAGWALALAGFALLTTAHALWTSGELGWTPARLRAGLLRTGGRPPAPPAEAAPAHSEGTGERREPRGPLPEPPGPDGGAGLQWEPEPGGGPHTPTSAEPPERPG
ncbi:MAG: hypothetical protein ACUVV6_04470 [Thermoplasmatota archaeon]